MELPRQLEWASAEANYQGANYGWQRYVGGLERVAAGLDGK
jgi:hypothetical protein